MYTMEQKRTRRNKKLVVLVTIGPLLLVLITGFIAYKNLQADVAPEASKPLFTFEESKAQGWWAADNWYSTSESTNDSQDDKSLIVGRNFFSGTREQPGTCFAMYFYKEGKVDVAAEIRNIEENTKNQDGSKGIQKLGTHNYAMQTPDGTKEFTLHQYELIGADAAQSAKGNQYAFVPLDKGYIEIRSICETAEQLSEAQSVFEAVRLEK